MVVNGSVKLEMLAAALGACSWQISDVVTNMTMRVENGLRQTEKPTGKNKKK